MRDTLQTFAIFVLPYGRRWNMLVCLCSCLCGFCVATNRTTKLFGEPYFRFDKANHQLCHRETLIRLMWQLLKIYNRSKTNPTSVQYGQRFYHFHVYVFRRLYFRLQRVLMTTGFCYLFESIETNLSKLRGESTRDSWIVKVCHVVFVQSNNTLTQRERMRMRMRNIYKNFPYEYELKLESIFCNWFLSLLIHKCLNETEIPFNDDVIVEMGFQLKIGALYYFSKIRYENPLYESEHSSSNGII